jgi:hypothetical protein
MNDPLEETLAQLGPLHGVPARSAEAARAGLRAFLDEAAQRRAQPLITPAPARSRLAEWQLKLTQVRSPRLALAFKLAVVLIVIFGGAGVTVAAAQNSLPDETLYPVKVLSEEVRLALASGADDQIDVQLERAQQRIREMEQLTDRGAAIPADVLQQLQEQLQSTLHIAAQLDDAHLPPALDRIQQRTQDQLREMDRLRQRAAEAEVWQYAKQVVQQTREMARLGAHDPVMFRARFRQQRPIDVPTLSLPSSTPRPSQTPSATASSARTAQRSRK